MDDLILIVGIAGLTAGVFQLIVDFFRVRQKKEKEDRIYESVEDGADFSEIPENTKKQIIEILLNSKNVHKDSLVDFVQNAGSALSVELSSEIKRSKRK